MKMRLDVCVVGYGLMGKTHCQMYDSNPYVKQIAVVEPNLISQDPLTHNKETEFLRSKPEQTFDIISICVPSAYHFKVFEDYAKSAKAFLIEKPLTLSLEEAHRMEEIAQRLDLLVGCAFVERFNPQIRRFKEITSAVGKDALHYYFKRIAPKPSPDSWYSRDELSGGPLFDLGVHDVDLVRWIVGDGFADISAKEKDGIISCEFKFPSDLIAHITTGWHESTEFTNSVLCEGNDLNLFLGASVLDEHRYPDAYKSEIESFIELFSGNNVEYPLIKDGVKALELIHKIKESMNK